MARRRATSGILCPPVSKKRTVIIEYVPNKLGQNYGIQVIQPEHIMIFPQDYLVLIACLHVHARIDEATTATRSRTGPRRSIGTKHALGLVVISILPCSRHLR